MDTKPNESSRISRSVVEYEDDQLLDGADESVGSDWVLLSPPEESTTS